MPGAVPPLSQYIRISEIFESEEVLGDSVNRKERNALSVPLGGDGSPTYTQNEQRKQRLVLWRGHRSAQSPTWPMRRSACHSSSVQNRWTTCLFRLRICSSLLSKVLGLIHLRHLDGGATASLSGRHSCADCSASRICSAVICSFNARKNGRVCARPRRAHLYASTRLRATSVPSA